MHHQPRPAAGSRVNIPLEIDSEELRPGAARNLLIGNERFHPSGLQIRYANASFPTRVPVRIRHPVRNIYISARIDRNRARLSELRPLRDEIAVLIQYLNTVVAAVRDVQL